MILFWYKDESVEAKKKLSLQFLSMSFEVTFLNFFGYGELVLTVCSKISKLLSSFSAQTTDIFTLSYYQDTVFLKARNCFDYK